MYKKRRITNNTTLNFILIICFILIILFVYILNSNPIIDTNNYKITDCKETLVEYDEIFYYKLKDTSKIILGKNELEEKIINRYFSNLKDSIYFKKIDSIYSKTALNLKSKQFIHSFICKNKLIDDNLIIECLPFFRDILVFKKDKKIVGINKICFECGISNFVSKEYDISYFNEEEMKILEQYLKK